MILLADSEGPDETARMGMLISHMPEDTFLHGADQIITSYPYKEETEHYSLTVNTYASKRDQSEQKVFSTCFKENHSKPKAEPLVFKSTR